MLLCWWELVFLKLSHLISLKFYKGFNWRIYFVITLFIGSTLNIIFFTILSVKTSLKIIEILNISNLDIFSNYFAEVTV